MPDVEPVEQDMTATASCAGRIHGGAIFLRDDSAFLQLAGELR